MPDPKLLLKRKIGRAHRHCGLRLYRGLSQLLDPRRFFLGTSFALGALGEPVKSSSFAFGLRSRFFGRYSFAFCYVELFLLLGIACAFFGRGSLAVHRGKGHEYRLHDKCLLDEHQEFIEAVFQRGRERVDPVE